MSLGGTARPRWRVALATGLTLAGASIVASPAPAGAAVSTLRPVADTYVGASAPRRAHGRSRVLRVGSSPARRSYLRFRPGRLRAPVARVVLRLHPTRRSRGAVRVHLLPRAARWSERRTTYARAPAPRGAGVRSRARRGRLEVDLTRMLATVPPRVDLVLTGSGAAALASRETRRAPRLVVQTGAPPGGSPPGAPVIAAVGDIACDPASSAFNGGAGTATRCGQRRTAQLVAERAPTAVLTLGDHQYADGTAEEFQRGFHSSWGSLTPLIRPVPGNHEYHVAQAGPYFDYFNGAGRQTGRAGDRSAGHYSFDIGAWHIVALNSNVSTSAGSAQERWLRADLSAHPAACTLAFVHHPRWSSGEHGGSSWMSALWNALHAAGAELLLSGHDHDYERFAPQGRTSSSAAAGVADPVHGIRQFVVGTGGVEHTPIAAVSPNSEARDDRTFGVLELTLHADRYDWRFVPEHGRTYTDEGTAPCR